MNRIGIYLRLSKEDEYSKEESNSISNQRILIMNYIHSHKEFYGMEVKEYSDDGYSGKNMNRPGIQSLLKEIKNGTIQCIIVKDLSRFSRDHITLSQHMELIFPFMNIRFIALSDYYDSDQCEGGIGNIDIAFKSLIYDFYSEDLSLKVKSSLDTQRASGRYIATMAPYGYKKNPEDKHQLLVDEEAAKVVKRIFREYLEGNTMYGIAQELNEEGIPSKIDYIRKRDGQDYQWKKEKYFWNTVSISKLLYNEVYKGTLVYGKEASKEVGAHRKETLPKEVWKKVPHAIPAIVDQEVFEEVQKKLKKNITPQKKHKENVLKGKIICASCGSVMYHSNQGRPKYVCRNRFYEKNPDCVSSIRDEDLEEILLSLLREKMDHIRNIKEVLEEKEKERKERIRSAYGRLQKMEKTMTCMEDDLMEGYESYREGIIEKETYIQQKELFEEMKVKLHENMEKQKQAIEKMEEKKILPANWNIKENQLEIEELDSIAVDLFIQKVIVDNNGMIEIIWNIK